MFPASLETEKSAGQFGVRVTNGYRGLKGIKEKRIEYKEKGSDSEVVIPGNEQKVCY